MSVSEYVTTNVKAKPVTFLYETNHGCTVVSHMCSCNTPTYKKITYLTAYHTGGMPDRSS